MRKSGFLMALMASVLAACGGGSEDDAFQGGGTTGGGTAAEVASVTLITSSTTIPSNGSTPAEITALVRNASNQFMADVPVIFSANNNGGLTTTQGTTDENGIARASLTNVGDASSRTITVTAMAGSQTATVDVSVAGSTLAITGPTGLTQSQAGNYTATLLSSGGQAVSGAVLTITSTPTATITPASVTTNSSGQANFTVTATTGGARTLTVAGMGLSTSLSVAVNSDTFSFISPAATPVTETALNTPRQVTVRWLVNGAPIAVGSVVNFSTTRGTLSGVTPTNAQGDAFATVTATNAGAAIVTASGGSSTAQVPLEFIATVPATINLQPSIFTLSPGQTSTITAVVRDAAGNLVKNQPVAFTLTDVTGGTLSVGAAITDSQGRAQTVYTAGPVTSANEGVIVQASVGAAPPAQVALTVAGRQVFLSIGTGNELSEPNTAQYRVEYIVQVTDSNGNGVANVPVSLRILSQTYFKGNRVAAVAPATGWSTTYTVPAGCPDEDVNNDGVLDLLTEDFNGSGSIEAGNIASVSPSNAMTDADGFVLVNVYYPQEFAYYLAVSLSASATVQGSEYVRSSNFILSGLATDFNDATKAPPGPVSPFGVANICGDPN